MSGRRRRGLSAHQDEILLVAGAAVLVGALVLAIGFALMVFA